LYHRWLASIWQQFVARELKWFAPWKGKVAQHEPKCQAPAPSHLWSSPWMQQQALASKLKFGSCSEQRISNCWEKTLA
jgi:hypothetical protein